MTTTPGKRSRRSCDGGRHRSDGPTLPARMLPGATFPVLGLLAHAERHCRIRLDLSQRLAEPAWPVSNCKPYRNGGKVSGANRPR